MVNVPILMRRMRGAAGSGLPIKTGLVVDIDASVGMLDSGGAPADNNENVATMVDQSGLGFNFTQGTDSKRPKLLLNELDGYPALKSDGVDDFMSPVRMSGRFQTGITYYAIIRFADGRPSVLKRPMGGRNGDFSYFEMQLATNGALIHTQEVTTSSFHSAEFLSSGGLPDGDTGYFLVHLTAGPDTTSRAYHNGDFNNASTTITAANWAQINGQLNAETPYLFATNLGSDAGHAEMYIVRFLAYEGIQSTDAQRTLIEDYFKRKYPSLGLTTYSNT